MMHRHCMLHLHLLTLGQQVSLLHHASHSSSPALGEAGEVSMHVCFTGEYLHTTLTTQMSTQSAGEAHRSQRIASRVDGACQKHFEISVGASSTIRFTVLDTFRHCPP